MANDLNIDYIHSELKKWEALGKKLKLQYEAFQKLTGCDSESPMWAPVFKLWEAYTKELAQKLGDEHGWLEWFDLENEMGARGFIVTVENVNRTIRSVADLVWVLTGENPRSNPKRKET